MRNQPDHWNPPSPLLPSQVPSIARRVGLLIVVLTMLAAMLTASAVFAGPQECKSSVCRTSTANAIGSGVCYGRAANGDVLVLTAKHCVRNFSVTCEFFLGSEYAVKTKGRVVAVSRNRDLAAVRILASEFSGRFPSGVQVADMPPEIGDKIHTMGCPRGATPTALAGKVLDYPTPLDMAFSPPPASGRSGSAIFDATGESVVGILTKRRWSSGLPTHGLAESTEAIGGFFGPRTATAAEAIDGTTKEAWWWPGKLMRRGDCKPGDNCGPGGCGPGGGDNPGPVGPFAPGADWIGPGLPADKITPDEPVAPIADDPVEPVPVVPTSDPPKADPAIAVLTQQIAKMQVQINQLVAAGTQGLRGEKGEQGPKGDPGTPAANIDVDQIVTQVVNQLADRLDRQPPNQTAMPTSFRLVPRK